jgi:hypothetical protein
MQKFLLLIVMMSTSPFINVAGVAVGAVQRHGIRFFELPVKYVLRSQVT